MSIWSLSLESFRDGIAADPPVPSCGATACVCASFGLALLLMALRKSAGLDPNGEIRKLIFEAEQLMAAMKAHADNDVRTFRAYIEEPEAEANGHSHQLTLEVTLGALAAARCCVEGIELAELSLHGVKPVLQCDVIAAVFFLHASLSALLLNVDADANQLVPSDRKIQLMHDRRELQRLADEVVVRVGHLRTPPQG